MLLPTTGPDVLMRSLDTHNIVNLATRAEAAANRFARTALIMIVTHVSNAAISFPAAVHAEEEERHGLQTCFVCINGDDGVRHWVSRYSTFICRGKSMPPLQHQCQVQRPRNTSLLSNLLVHPCVPHAARLRRGAVLSLPYPLAEMAFFLLTFSGRLHDHLCLRCPLVPWRPRPVSALPRRSRGQEMVAGLGTPGCYRPGLDW